MAFVDVLDLYQHMYGESCESQSLHIYLKCLNWCGKFETNLPKHLSDDVFRRHWLEVLRQISTTISNARNQNKNHFKITTDCFPSVTCAFIVKLRSYVEDSKYAQHSIDCKEIGFFLCETRKCFTRKHKTDACFQLLINFLELLNPKRTADILRELRQFIKSAPTINKTDTILTVAHILILFADSLVQFGEQFDMDAIFQLIDCLVKEFSIQNDYVKFCDECKQQNMAYGGYHELGDVISVAMKFSKNDINEKHRLQLSKWNTLRESCLNKLNCRKSEQQKKQAEIEMYRMQQMSLIQSDTTSVIPHLNNSVSKEFGDFDEASILLTQNVCAIQKIIIDHSTNGQWENLLTQPFYEFGTWYASFNLTVKTMSAASNCSCDSKTTHSLLKVAIDIFGISWKQQSILEGRPIGGNIERLLEEDNTVQVLTNAANIINDSLHAYVNNELTLSANEFDFCLRCIAFIKIHLILFDCYSSILFTSLPRIVAKPMNNDLKLKLATLLAEYSHEYNDELNEIRSFSQECEELMTNENVSDISAQTKLICSAFIGLMYKRSLENVRGTKLLNQFFNLRIYKVIYLEYLATKCIKISGNRLVNPDDPKHNAQQYIREIHVTEAFYRDETHVKILSASLQAISVAKMNSPLDSDKTALIAFIVDVLPICERLGLQKQIVNLLLTLGSLQTDQIQRTMDSIKRNLAFESIGLGVDLVDSTDPYQHFDDCQCPMCTNVSIKLYIFRLRCLCDLNDAKEIRSLFQFWKSKIENKVMITDEYEFLRDDMISRYMHLKNVEEEQRVQPIMDQFKSKPSDSSETLSLQEQSTNDTYTTANSTTTNQSECKRRRLG